MPMAYLPYEPIEVREGEDAVEVIGGIEVAEDQFGLTFSSIPK